MSCQTQFVQGMFVDDYDSMGSQGEIFVRPSPFRLRTDIAAYIGVNQNTAKLHQDVSAHNYIHGCLIQPPPVFHR
jgi:hypothetical protein